MTLGSTAQSSLGNGSDSAVGQIGMRATTRGAVPASIQEPLRYLNNDLDAESVYMSDVGSPTPASSSRLFVYSQALKKSDFW